MEQPAEGVAALHEHGLLAHERQRPRVGVDERAGDELAAGRPCEQRGHLDRTGERAILDQVGAVLGEVAHLRPPFEQPRLGPHGDDVAPHAEADERRPERSLVGEQRIVGDAQHERVSEGFEPRVPRDERNVDWAGAAGVCLVVQFDHEPRAHGLIGPRARGERRDGARSHFGRPHRSGDARARLADLADRALASLALGVHRVPLAL